MIDVKHERSGLADALEGLSDGLSAVDEAHDEALGVIESQNADINFDLDHELTVVSREQGRIAVGSRSPSYAKLLTMDGEEVANVYRRAAHD